MIQRYEILDTVIPYVRMTRKGKFVNERARRYMDNQALLAAQIRNIMVEKGYETFPSQTPLSVFVTISVTSRLHTCDLDNQIKAILDAAQGLIFHSDMWIDRISSLRKISDTGYILLTVEEMK